MIWRIWVLPILILASASCLAGCSDTEQSSPTTPLRTGFDAAAAVPADAEIAGQLGLSEEQMAGLAPALEAWRQGERDAWQSERPHAAHEFWQGRRERLLNFLASCAEVLDTEQFVALVQMLAERMDSLREQVREYLDAGRPMRDFWGPRFEGHHPLLGRSHEILEELDLTEEQRQQIREFFAIQLASRSDAHPRDREAMRAWRQQVHQEWLEFRETVLTAEQGALLEQIREARRQERLERWQERLAVRAERRVSFLTTLLLLDTEQATQLADLVADAVTAAQSALDSHAAGDLTREELRSTLHENRDGLIEEIKMILDAEQLARFEALLELLPPRWF